MSHASIVAFKGSDGATVKSDDPDSMSIVIGPVEEYRFPG
jgi:hypothetical protein